MAKLTANISRVHRDGRVVDNVPVAASANIRQGSILEIDNSGRVKPATKGASKKYFGVAQAAADNSSGAAGAIKVSVLRDAAVLCDKSGTAVRGKDAYVIDDNTVTDVSAAASKLGVIIDTTDEGVWVKI